MTTTYAEFERAPNREPRVYVLITVKNASTGFFNFLHLSTKAGTIPGLSQYLHGCVGKTPTLTYSSKEISGALPIPTYSDLELIVSDGYDLSPDQSGIYLDDLGSTWIVRDQNISILFGGDDLPITEYKPVITSGTVVSLRKNDTGGVITVAGPEREIYKKTMASNKINATQWPNAAGNLGKSKPVCLGLCYNVKPLIVDQLTGPGRTTYMFNENSAYTALQVFDNGVLQATPANYTDNGDGTFTMITLVTTGEITCSVAGAYYLTWASQITGVLQGYGGITPARIDSAAVTAADTALPYIMGYYVSEETPVMDVVSKLSQGVPAWWGFDSSGLFTMREVVDPAVATATKEIANSVSSGIPVAFIDGTCTESPSGEVSWKIDFDYFQNYAPSTIDRLSNTLTIAQKQPFTTAWRTVTPAQDATVLTNYPFAVSVKKFARTTGPGSASALAAKWLALEKEERRLTELTVPMMDTYEIGDIVELTYATKLFDKSIWYKHGYNAKKMLVLNVSYNFNDYTIKLGLWS